MTQASPPDDPAARSNPPIIDHGGANAPGSPHPILIGVSGKREFDENDASIDAEIAKKVAARFQAIFDALDNDKYLKNTPKIVLTGGACGADLIAAETALRRGPNWAVAVVLAFDRKLFEEDFSPSQEKQGKHEWRERYAEHARQFERVLGTFDEPNPRALVRELPKLSTVVGDLATTEQLSRHSPHYNKTLRRNHYEQVGQFIAETATIMIAVMSGDERPSQSNANGGTARVVAYRRAGRPDQAGFDLAQRSQILRQKWPEVEPPPAGFVWLIDPQRGDRVGQYPVTVLPPLLDRLVEDVYGGSPGKDMPQEDGKADASPGRRSINALGAVIGALGLYDPEKRGMARMLRASLVVAKGFGRLNLEGSKTPGLDGDTSTADLSPVADVQVALGETRQRISARQREANSEVKQGFIKLAFLFVLAVSAFEIFTKFFHENAWPLGIYLAALAVIASEAVRAHRASLGEVAEDYRAVVEMLRVQRAWVAAGLRHRVDREHMQGVGQDLAPIREAAKTVIAWILLRYGWKDCTRQQDWAHVRGVETQPRGSEYIRSLDKPPDDWIGGQLAYFLPKRKEREITAQILDTKSWCLLVMSGCLALILWIWLAFPHALETILDKVVGPDNHVSHAVLWFALAVIVIKVRILFYDIREGWAIGMAIICGAAAAFGLALALVIVERQIACAATELGAKSALLQATSTIFVAVVVLSIFKFARWCPWALLLVAVASASAACVFASSPTENPTGAPALPPEKAAQYAMIALVVVLSAMAGSLRYLIDRLNIEAEALEYRDAYGRFQLAEKRLARIWDFKKGAPRDEKEAQRLVLELGSSALNENEAWLKSRRERPLTPVVG